MTAVAEPAILTPKRTEYGKINKKKIMKVARSKKA